ncbi:hypothetical protein [Kordiimonas laminariae]|uniref:hypothetical protein n=1 Tax=Kordiimonas laminariae TaxID=2917717 RepID=UPI001FF4D8CB|nr:hypothetical protein [Kordiimonas laminariae]MCK0070759.1 hypothetical protein [Kordiimonas laminariae]
MHLKTAVFIFIASLGISETGKANECKANYVEYTQTAKAILADSDQVASIVENIHLEKRSSVAFYCKATKNLPTAMEISSRALDGLKKLNQVKDKIRTNCPANISAKVNAGVQHLTEFLQEENKRLQPIAKRHQNLCG